MLHVCILFQMLLFSYSSKRSPFFQDYVYMYTGDARISKLKVIAKAAAPLADKSADLPADEISETPVDFSSVKNQISAGKSDGVLNSCQSFPRRRILK